MFEKEFLFSCRIIAFMFNLSTVMAVFIAFSSQILLNRILDPILERVYRNSYRKNPIRIWDKIPIGNFCKKGLLHACISISRIYSKWLIYYIHTFCCLLQQIWAL